MPNFIMLSTRIVNLSDIKEIDFPSPDKSVAIHWQSGGTRILTGLDAELLLRGLEKQYGLMTDPTIRYFSMSEEEEEKEIASLLWGR